MIVVGNFVGKIADLRFQRGLSAIEKTLAEFLQLARVLQRAMLLRFLRVFQNTD